MKKIMMLAAAAIGLVTAANAADLPSAIKAPAAAPASYSWTGLYLGANAGYGFSAFPLGIAPANAQAAALVNAIGNPGVIGPNAGGAVGGLHGGVDWQVSQSWVWGIAGSFDFTNIGSSASATAPATASLADQARVDWYGTFVGRVGYLVAPDVMLYGDGGLAVGNISHNATVSCAFGAAFCFSNGTSNVHTGWVAGLGVEWRFARNLSFGIDYQYVDLGKSSLLSTGTGATPASFISTDSANFNVVTGRFTLRF